jgi:hypothetical protein
MRLQRGAATLAALITLAAATVPGADAMIRPTTGNSPVRCGFPGSPPDPPGWFVPDCQAQGTR